MALITTPGDALANSYASVAYADTYHAARGNTAWAGTVDLKEAALIRGTDWLDGTYKDRWPGVRTNGRNQALDWDRTGAVDAAGNEIPAGTIPVEVLNADCEAALRELISPGALTPDVNPAQRVTRERAKAGPVEVETEYSNDGRTTALLMASVDNALAGLLSGGATASTTFLLRA